MQFREAADWRDEDLHAIGAQPLRGRHASAFRRLPWIRLTFTSVVFITLIAIYAPDRDMGDTAAPHSLLGAPPELLTPPSPWQDLAFSDVDVVIADEALASLPLSHIARVHEDGTLQDVVEIGTFRSTKPHLRILLERGSENSLASRSFFVDLALRAAHAGLAVARSLHEEPLATRDERYEVARVWLENGRTRTCLAFRTIDDVQSGLMVGWICGSAVSRDDLACAIEGLGLRHRETGLLMGGPRSSQAQSACPRALLVTKDVVPNYPISAESSPASPTTLASGLFVPPPPPRRPAEQ